MPASCDYANGYSYTSVGDAMPKCMWLDGDYTRGTENGDGFMQGLSFHLKDFEPTEERIKYYNLLPDTLCNSEPRMHQRHKFDSKAHIRVFDPPLKYIEGKLEEDYEHLWDTTLWGWSEEVWKRSALPFAKRAAEHLSTLTLYVSRLFTRAPAATSIYDRSEGTVIRSNHTSQSAVTLCDTPSMFGPDFVSLQEQIFCDMRTREKYPVCQPENSEARGTCFDL